jgi:hypothetical protein
MAFQSDCLRDALSCDGPAAPRVADLYPEEAIYRNTDVPSLQAHLVRLKKQNAELRETLQGFTLGRGLHTVGRKVAQYLRGRARNS